MTKPEGRQAWTMPSDLFTKEYREANKEEGRFYTLPELADLRRSILEEAQLALYAEFGRVKGAFTAVNINDVIRALAEKE